MKIVVVSGGFDPIHSGHIAYLSSAKDLVVILHFAQSIILEKFRITAQRLVNNAI